MKTTLFIIFLLATLVYSGEPTISFKPFKIAFEKPFIPFAIAFFGLTITLFRMQENRDSYKKAYKEAYKVGFDDGVEAVKEILEEMKQK